MTIPAGQSSSTFTATAINNGENDGLHQVEIFASASGLNTGVAVLGITNTDLPDLAVTTVTATPSTGNDNSPLSVSWTVSNVGLFATSGTWQDEVFLDPVGGNPSTTPVATVTLTSTLQPNQSYTQTDSSLAMPATVGQYTARVVTDANLSIAELSYANNTDSSSPFTDQASYTATVSANASVVPTGTPVTLSGTAKLTSNGQPAADVPVSVRILVNGTRRVLTATTNSSGQYSTVFQPLPYEAGIYSVAAADPGVTMDVIQTTFSSSGCPRRQAIYH